MRKINISAIVGSKVPVEEQIPLIKEVGFHGFFATYTGCEPLGSWARLVRKHQLDFETIQESMELFRNSEYSLPAFPDSHIRLAY